MHREDRQEEHMSKCDCAGRGCTGACSDLIDSMRYVADGLKFGFHYPTKPLKVQDVVHFLEHEIWKAEKKEQAEKNPRGCED